jgi:hypothetical protein
MVREGRRREETERLTKEAKMRKLLRRRREES